MGKISNFLFQGGQHVCPRWLCFTFDNVFRKLFQKPYKILQSYIKEGNTVLDVGPGIGYFTIPMAKMVGENGRVIAVDIQEKMLWTIGKRAQHAGMQKRISLQLASSASLGVRSRVDFILAFWMVHEVPDEQQFFAEMHSLLKDDGKFLMVEPKIHVIKAQFAKTVRLALKAGFTLGDNPNIFLGRAALFIKIKE